jgi:hypothetical protein
LKVINPKPLQLISIIKRSPHTHREKYSKLRPLHSKPTNQIIRRPTKQCTEIKHAQTGHVVRCSQCHTIFKSGQLWEQCTQCPSSP